MTPGLISKLPTVQQANANFMQNNPQFGSAATPYGSAPQPGQSAYLAPASAGAKAKSPATKATPPVNTIAKSQVEKPTTQTASAANAYPQGLIGNLNIAANGSPEVQSAQDEIQRYQNSYANANAGLGLGGQDFSYVQGTEANLGNQYQTGLASREQALNNALTQQGQKITANQGVASLAHPEQVAPGNFYVNPTTGNDVSGGTINPFSGGMRQAEVAAGQNYVQQGTSISKARSAAQNLNSLLSSSGLNSSQLALSNWVGNVAAQNMSNPKLAPIQSAINNAVSQYADALGVPANALMNSLTAQSSGQSITSLMNSLDQQAYGSYQATRNVGSGGTVSPTNPSTGGQLNPTSAAILQKYGIQ